MSFSSIQQQLQQMKSKYESQVKKNNSLLKMNSNLMRQNQQYQNCFSMLKKWSNQFIAQMNSDQQLQEVEDSSVDIEQDGEQFINSLIQLIQRKIQQLTSQTEQQKYHLATAQKQQMTFTSPLLHQQCPDCSRWKELYIKETKQTERLQKLIDDSSLLHTQKQLNIVKLKDDLIKLLDDYWNLYRKLFSIDKIDNPLKPLEDNSKIFINSRETVRPKEKNKEKRSSSNSGSKSKKANTNPSNKQPTPFSKQKTSRNNIKYAIQLNAKKQSQEVNDLQANLIQSMQQIPLRQLSGKLNQVLSSYSEVSKSLQQENTFLKEQLKEFTEILGIYREKERNRILFK